jgi:hypothetical protein
MSAMKARQEPAVGHHGAGSTWPGRSSLSSATLGVNLLVWAGCLLLGGSAVIHFYLWNSHGYKNIPTIGPLFLAQAIVGILVAVATAVSRRLVLVAAAAGLLVSSIGGLLISIWWGLFGWQETASAPYVGLALWVEALGAALLGTATVLLGWPWLVRWRAAGGLRSWRASRASTAGATGRGGSDPGT